MAATAVSPLSSQNRAFCRINRKALFLVRPSEKPPAQTRLVNRGRNLLAVGLWRSDWRDDIRQWVNMPTAMLTEVQQIGQLSGTDFGGKYLVAEAQSEDALLKKTAELGRALQPLIAQGKLSGIQSPDQFILPTTEQQKLQNRLRELTKLPDSWKPLTRNRYSAQNQCAMPCCQAAPIRNHCRFQTA